MICIMGGRKAKLGEDYIKKWFAILSKVFQVMHVYSKITLHIAKHHTKSTCFCCLGESQYRHFFQGKNI